MKRLLILAAAALAVGATPQETVARVRAWRVEHEKPILRELFDFLSIPNVATNQSDIRRNAEALNRMFERRRFAPEILSTGTGTSPLVVAERRLPNVRRTITFYFHYDGQPVDAVPCRLGEQPVDPGLLKQRHRFRIVDVPECVQIRPPHSYLRHIPSAHATLPASLSP